MTGPRRALLDASVLIDYPADRVAEVADELAVSAITMAELHYGVSASPDPLEQLRRRQRLQLVNELYDVLPFDARTAEYYGALATALRSRGRNPRPRRMDLQIAATAARHDLALITHNTADFAGLDETIEIIGLR
ncbi:type II toxin-antitoxin system VapC family toxin [Pseudonocardia acaciae]|uniref:type II toxin-antitoxin system VapC family toxin n=1 Tax=Pseudonocardia acaciae TaxID=551276 RepID=UPI00048DE81E|nr:type II toxin-antitoxin system VapC family toxin [Pseudonocardia acaciae]